MPRMQQPSEVAMLWKALKAPAGSAFALVKMPALQLGKDELSVVQLGLPSRPTDFGQLQPEEAMPHAYANCHLESVLHLM